MMFVRSFSLIAPTRLRTRLRQQDPLAGTDASCDFDDLVVREAERHSAQRWLAGCVQDLHGRGVLVVPRHRLERARDDALLLGDDDPNADIHAGFEYMRMA